MWPCAHDRKCQSLLAWIVGNDWHFVLFFKCLLLIIGGLMGGERLYAQAEVNVDSVMQRVYTYVERTGIQESGFTSEVYVQHYLRTKRRGIIMRYLPGALHLQRGENEYFGESLSSYQFLPPAQVDKKDIAAFNTMPYVTRPRDRWIGRYSMSIYEPNFFTDCVLSPFNVHNRLYYKFRFKYTYLSLGRRIAHIEIEPRIWNSQLVRGDADIDVWSGEVRLFSLQFFYGWSRLHVTGEMGEQGRASLLPKKVSLVSRLKMFGNSLEERFDATAKYDFTKSLEVVADSALDYRRRFDMTNLCRLRIDTTRMKRDLAFFEKNRPVKLMPFQEAIYDKAAERQQVKRDTMCLSPRAQRLDRAEDLFLDSHTLQIGEKGKVKLPPVLTPAMVEWSKNDGFSLRTRLSFDFNLTKFQKLQFRPRVGYNFKQKQVYWDCPLIYRFLPRYDGMLRIDASGGDHIYNSKQADEVREELKGIVKYDSLLSVFDSYQFQYYRDQRFSAEYSMQPIVGLRLCAGLRFHQRKMLNWNRLSAVTSMQRTLTSFAPGIRVEWTPGLYYYRENQRPVPLRTKWPTFMVDYERSVKAVDPHTSYERVEFDASYRMNLYALRTLYFRIGGGLYTQRGENCFLDYENFRNNHMVALSSNDFVGQFQLLNNHWYNESNYYLRMSASYESPMMLFSRIKYLTRIVEREYLFCNLLTVRSLKMYTEFGYGISLPLLNLAAFGSIAGKGQSAFGCKVSIHLGDFY